MFLLNMLNLKYLPTFVIFLVEFSLLFFSFLLSKLYEFFNLKKESFSLIGISFFTIFILLIFNIPLLVFVKSILLVLEFNSDNSYKFALFGLFPLIWLYISDSFWIDPFLFEIGVWYLFNEEYSVYLDLRLK